MVQLAVYAADSDSHKQPSKKASWPIGVEEDFVEVPLPEKEDETEVAVTPAGCCTCKRAVMCLVLWVLVAVIATGAVVGVLYATQGPCGLGIEVDGCSQPQTGDALEPPTPTPDYDCDYDGRPGHGGHHDHDHDSRPDDDDDDSHGRPDDGDHNGGHHGGPDHDGHHGDHHDHGNHGNCHHHGHRPHRPGRPFPRPRQEGGQDGYLNQL